MADKKKDLIIVFIIMALFCLQHLLSFHLGINFEEARDGNAYSLAMQGYKPYRDFEWVYGPFSFLIYPFIMKIFGVKLIVLRLSYIIFASLVIPLTYFLSRKIMPPLWSGIAAFLAINFFDVPYYTFNHIFVVLGELGCLLMIVNGIKTSKIKSHLLGAGFFAVITLLTKPFFSGIILLFSVFLLILIIKVRNQLPARFMNAIILFIAPVFLFAGLFVCLYLGGAIKNFFLESIPIFSPDPVGSLYNVGGVGPLSVIVRLSQRFFGLFAINKVFTISSFIVFKKAMVDWFDNFIFCLPFLTPLAIFIIYNRFGKTNIEIQKIFKNREITILSFIIFSILISAENLAVSHRMGRAFNIQTTFILLCFFLYLLLNGVSKIRKAFVFSLIVIFTLSLSSLHFFRYPWSRHKKFTEALNLERAQGVLVTPAEKHLYESLSSFLSGNLSKDEKIVILGYNPQFSFLTEQKNMFENEECIFIKLENLTELAEKDIGMLSKLKLLEDKIIYKMESKKPKIVLDIVYEGKKSLYNNSVGNYIKKKYVLEKTFGPAEIRGDGLGIGRVDLFVLRGD